MLEKKVQKLLWLDMEMTGLDPATNVIIEVAALVTDLSFNILDTYETVVRQPQHYLDQMDKWNTEHHTKSGLVRKVPYGRDPKEVESDLIQLSKKHFPITGKKEDKPILAGNSIMQDRTFIDLYMPQFGQLLHYRQLDVSSWKIMFNNKYNVKYEKKNNHRALDDIKESINELKMYLGYINLSC
jgi:oligoribonuclease